MKKNKFKSSLIFMVFVTALLCLPLQLPSYADTQAALDKDIAAVTKEPVSKKKIAFKFIMAMLGVATSSIVIYVGLSAYNKLFKSQSASVIGLNNIKSLKSPENFRESINLFLEKTNWD